MVLTHTTCEPKIFDWTGLDPTVGLFKILNGAYWKFFYTGSVGVILFFIISGFCIHYPYSKSLRIDGLKGYFTRRFLRIGLPVLPVVFYYNFVAGMGPVEIFSRTVLWSIACEIIYYILYPFLLRIRKASGNWWWLIFFSYLAAIGIALTDPANKSYWAFGPLLTWILGLPCWLAGAALAEVVQNPGERTTSTKSIWIWRSAAWFLAVACVSMTFRGSFGDPWTLNLFAIFAFFWLKKEIEYAFHVAPPRWLEIWGGWSYSLYITHTIFWNYWKSYLNLPLSLGPLGYFGSLAALLATGYFYYRVFEKPSHYFSRAAGNWANRKSPSGPAQPIPKIP